MPPQPPAEATFNWTSFLIENLLGGVSGSLILALLLFLSYRFALSRVVHEEDGRSPDERRRVVVGARNLALFVLAVGLAFIWGEQLRTFAVSVVVLASAIVLATKEIIMCISGSLLRTLSRIYKVGDRIEIGALRGDVIDANIFVTKLMEVGPGAASHQRTGRIITVPNSMMFTNSVINDTDLQEYVIHAIPVTLPPDGDWRRAERCLLDAAGEEIAPYIEAAQANLKRLTEELALDVPALEPRVLVGLDGVGKVALTLRVPVPAKRRGRHQDAILRRFLELYHRAPAATSGTAAVQ